MKKLCIVMAILVVLLCAGSSALAADGNAGMVTVQTKFGPIRGEHVSEELIIYKGVPYAKPPVGDLRWTAPVDPEPWTEVMDCTKFNPMGMQIMDMNCWWAEDLWYPWLDSMGGTYPEFVEKWVPGQDGSHNMSEDSLYLQIYSPAASPDANLPVLVWIHGGASRHGVTYDAQAASEELARASTGAIVVAVEYRMGIFGFYTSDELDAEQGGHSGNYGLLDNIKALEWINNNIKAFGGDPSRVIIGGQSAGAGMVTQLMTSPLLKDEYWSGAFMCSRFQPMGSLTSMDSRKNSAKTYLNNKNLGGKTLAELRAEPAVTFCREDIAQSEYSAGSWGSCLDGYVLTQSPIEFYTTPNVLKNKNLVFGSTSGESNAGFAFNLTKGQIFADAKAKYGDLYDKYNFEYIYRTTDYSSDSGAGPDDPAPAAHLDRLRLNSQLNAIAGMYDGAYLKSLNPTSNFYCFFFSHWTPGYESELRWAWHSADLWYWFDSMRDVKEQRDWTKLDYQIGDWCSEYWVNLATNGNPNGEGLPVWNPSTPEDINFIDLGDEFVNRDKFYENSHQYQDRDNLMSDYTLKLYGYDGMFDSLLNP